jgi:hypothetical protein
MIFDFRLRIVKEILRSGGTAACAQNDKQLAAQQLAFRMTKNWQRSSLRSE